MWETVIEKISNLRGPLSTITIDGHAMHLTKEEAQCIEHVLKAYKISNAESLRQLQKMLDDSLVRQQQAEEAKEKIAEHIGLLQAHNSEEIRNGIRIDMRNLEWKVVCIADYAKSSFYKPFNPAVVLETEVTSLKHIHQCKAWGKLSQAQKLALFDRMKEIAQRAQVRVSTAGEGYEESKSLLDKLKSLLE